MNHKVSSGSTGRISANIHTALYNYEIIVEGSNYTGQVNFTSEMKVFNVALTSDSIAVTTTAGATTG